MEPERVKSLLAFLIVGGFIGMMAAWFYFPLKGDPQVFIQMLGVLGSGGFMVIVAYYFGSSSGSKTKDDTIASIAKGTQASEPEKPMEAKKNGGGA